MGVQCYRGWSRGVGGEHRLTEYVPAVHCVQDVIDADLYEPAEQVVAVHDDAPAKLVVPAAHAVQLVAPAAEYVPAAHVVQLVAPAAE